MRTKGSCRFPAYYKNEWRDESIGVWRPLQKTFASLLEADAAKTPGKTWRTFEVSEKGRRQLP